MTAPTDPRVQPGERGQKVSDADLAATLALDLSRARATIAEQGAEIARLTAENEQFVEQIAMRRSDSMHAELQRVMQMHSATVKRAEAAEARVAELVEALERTLPMARGYAHEHPVGANQRKVNDAEEALSAARFVSGEAKDAPSPAEGERS